MCDYNGLKMKLSDNITPEFLYQKKDGSWLKLRILKFKNYGENSHETLWIFTDSESGNTKLKRLINNRQIIRRLSRRLFVITTFRSWIRLNNIFRLRGIN